MKTNENVQVQKLNPFTQVQLIDEIIVRMQGKHLTEESIDAASPYINAFAKMNNLSTGAALIFPAFFNNFSDSRIVVSDIARFYVCTQVKILTYWSAIEELVERKFISQYKKGEGEVHFAIPQEVVSAMRENTIYTPETYADLPIDKWLEVFSKLIYNKDRNLIPYDNFVEDLRNLINNNQHLIIARELARFYDDMNLVLFVGIMNHYIKNNDDHIVKEDIEDLFDSPWVLRTHIRMLERNTHPLEEVGLIEQSDSMGMVEADAWKMTEKAKEMFLKEVDTSVPESENKDIIKADKITPKVLFFNSSVSKQIEHLETLLQEDRFAEVQENLAKHGMRRGFPCIFYGAPGTGKTESVMQLARKTGRGIMMVDVPNLRDKYVGETEKNTKAIFEKYRQACRKAKVAPILLFNEADAILCKRKKGATDSVDKMENAMQNIILQEMENMEGILIATTNLTGNLDDAFERRFLYKIEFPKPTPNESLHIWQSMLPELTEPEALELASQYSFSGGQIENIVRKQIVNAVLSGVDKVNLEAVIEACETELFNNKTKREKIGF